ncbi:MAG: hypothetical protein DRJ52_00800 [Thermoprotei archaeon]|nr:MAG: hypothetical protein DRJ52_00800 [Thermoprotei archaeon]RLF00444.1 MAG: hypothetical protein DRJ63_02515 [Thermoprotei archaeon]
MGVCDICLNSVNTLYVCPLCGRKVCELDFDKEKDVCACCADTLCRICGKNLSIALCENCERQICEDCAIEVSEHIYFCKECFQSSRKYKLSQSE